MYISLDLETTGFDPIKDKIIEFGAVKFNDHGETIETLQFLVNPGIIIPQIITHITNITDEELKIAPSFEDKVEEIKNFIQDLPIIGHNIQFDMGFLETNGISLTNDQYDTQVMATIILPKMPSFSLEILSKALKLTHKEKHRALDDSIAAMELFLKLLKKFEELDPELLKTLQELSLKSNWPLKNLLQKTISVAAEQKPELPEPTSFETDPNLFELVEKILTSNTSGLFEVSPQYKEIVHHLLPKAKSHTHIAIDYHLFRQIQNEIPNTFAKIDAPKNYISIKRLENFKNREFFENHEISALLKYLVWLSQTKTGLLSEVCLFNQEKQTIALINIDESINNPPGEHFFAKALEKDQGKPTICTHQYLIESGLKNLPTNSEGELLLLDFESFLYSLRFSLSTYLKLDFLLQTLQELQSKHPENQTIQSLSAKCTILFGIAGILFDKGNDQNVFAPRSAVMESTITNKDWQDCAQIISNLIEISMELGAINTAENYPLLQKWKTQLKTISDFFKTPNLETHYAWLEKDPQGEIILRKIPYSVAKELNQILGQFTNYKIISENLDLMDAGSFIKNFSGLPENLALQKLITKSENLEITLIKDINDSDKNQLPNFLEEYLRKTEEKTAMVFTAKQNLEFITLKLSQANVPTVSQLTGSTGKLQELYKEALASKLLPHPILLVTPNVWENCEITEEIDTLFIHKLPFEPPSDPQLTALSQVYSDPFKELQIPRAIMALKKLLNKLNTQDKGKIKKVIILDSRLLNKPYGQEFIKNLEEVGTITIKTLRQVN